VSWLRSCGLSAEVDAVLSGDLRPRALSAPVFIPGAEGGGIPAWTAAADRLTGDQRAAAAVWQLAAAGGDKVRRLAPDAQVVYGAGGWARAPGWMRLKALTCGVPYRVLAEPELAALGAAQLALPESTAPAAGARGDLR
jgi:xylulokinase